MKNYRLLIFDWEGTLAMHDSHLFADTLATLKILKLNYLLAVATNCSRSSLNQYLKTNQLNNYFATTYCADETADKPNPLMLQQTLTELSVTADQALMIGDSENDLLMAELAGVDFIGVNFSKLAKLQPITFIQSLSELVKCL